MDNKQLLQSALKFLGYRPRSKKEIIDFLHKKTQDQTLINQTIEQLENQKLINDEEFANWLVKSRSRNRGSVFIKQDLKKYGIDVKNVETDDLDIAINLLKKKHPLWESLSPNAYRLKAYQYLSYRGFPSSVIAEAWKTVYNDSHVS